MGRQRQPAGTGREPKVCIACGREIQWRAKWARDWQAVRYCSDACRRRGVRPVDAQLEDAIRELLDAHGATICPSEAARAVAARRGGPADGEAWRELMEPARRAARRLVVAGEIEITQRGQVVDPSTAKGPIRIRRRSGGPRR